jgi:uncharacterized protein YyaL (SSP411 family)
MYNNNDYYNEWMSNKDPRYIYSANEANHWTMAQELERERKRMSKALSMIPQLIKQETTPTLEEFSVQAELSMAEILLDNWDNILQLAVDNKRLSGEVVVLLGQIEKMNEQVERMSTAIYTAIENTIRPIRDKRIHDEKPSEEF